MEKSTVKLYSVNYTYPSQVPGYMYKGSILIYADSPQELKAYLAEQELNVTSIKEANTFSLADLNKEREDAKVKEAKAVVLDAENKLKVALQNVAARSKALAEARSVLDQLTTQEEPEASPEAKECSCGCDHGPAYC